jgi:O-antigen ligase
VHAIIVFIQGVLFYSNTGFNQIFLLSSAGDNVYGLFEFGYANILGFLFLIPLFYVLIISKFRVSLKVVITFFFLSCLILMSAKAALLTFIVMILFYYFIKIRISKKSILLLVFAGLIFISLLNQYVQELSPVNFIAVESNQDYVGDAARIAHFKYAYDLIISKTGASLIGFGPSSYESPAGWYFHSSLIQEKEKYFESLKANTQTSNIVVTHTQFTTLMVELGFVGLIVFELFIIFLIIELYNLSKKEINNKSYIYFSIILLCVFFIAQISLNSFQYQLVFMPLYAIVAISIKINTKKEESLQLKNKEQLR